MQKMRRRIVDYLLAIFPMSLYTDRIRNEVERSQSLDMMVAWVRSLKLRGDLVPSVSSIWENRLCNRVGEIYEAKNMDAKAIKYYKQCTLIIKLVQNNLKQFHSFNGQFMAELATCYNNLALACKSSNRFEEADMYYS